MMLLQTNYVVEGTARGTGPFAPSGGPIQPARLTDRWLNSSASADQVEDKNDDCNDEQKVNQAAANGKVPTKQPQYEKYNDDCPKHGNFLLTNCLAIASAEGCAA